MRKWMSVGLWMFVCFALLLLGACSTADTTGSTTDREYRQDINTGGGNVVIYAPINIKASTAQNTDQETDNDPRNETSPRSALGLNGSTGTLADEGASMVMEGVRSMIDASMRDNQEEVQPSQATEQARKEIGDPGETADKTETTPAETTETGGYNTKEVKDLRAVEGRSFIWLDHTGSYYGKEVKVSFDNGCSGFIVKDPSRTQGASGNKGTHHQEAYWFCGTDPELRPGERLPEFNASVFTAPGCVATTVTLLYNK